MHNNRDDHQSRMESYTETVTDFEFCIDINLGTTTRPTHWSVADFEPVYRGLMVHEVEESTGKRLATRAEKKAYARWLEERRARGLPPWITNMDSRADVVCDEARPLRSSKTLRQWADEYCASPKYLKEFVYRKVSAILLSAIYVISRDFQRSHMVGISRNLRSQFAPRSPRPDIGGALKSISQPTVRRSISGPTILFQECCLTSGLSFCQSCF